MKAATGINPGWTAMPAKETIPIHTDACIPQWVRWNDRVLYCVKSMMPMASLAGGASRGDSGNGCHCAQKKCVFSAKVW